MIEILVNTRIQVIGVSILVFAIVLGLAETSKAVDLEFGMESVAIASDNIDRGPVSEATEGYLLSLDGDLTISSDVGASRTSFSLGGGWETKEAEVVSNSRNYHVQLTSKIPWSSTGYVQGLAAASEGIGEPDLTDISQVRVRSKTSELSFEVGRQTSPTFKWNTGMKRETEDRYDRDFDELQTKLGWEKGLDRTRTLLVNMDLTRGNEKIEGDEWSGSSALLDLRRRTESVALTGYQLAWEGVRLDQKDGTSGWSEVLTMLFHYEMGTAKKWSFSSDLGMDGLKTAGEERRWEPHASVDAGSSKEKRLRVSTSLSAISNIQDPTEDQYSWTRNTQGRAAVAWRITRTITTEPSVRVLTAELFGIDSVDRTDKVTILGVETKWLPDRDWSVAINGYSEERKSSDGTFDLTETRIELRVSGLFN